MTCVYDAKVLLSHEIVGQTLLEAPFLKPTLQFMEHPVVPLDVAGVPRGYFVEAAKA